MLIKYILFLLLQQLSTSATVSSKSPEKETMIIQPSIQVLQQHLNGTGVEDEPWIQDRIEQTEGMKRVKVENKSIGISNFTASKCTIFL